MKCIIIVTLFSICCFTKVTSQEIVLEKNVNEMYADSTGPNMKSFGQVYASMGFCAQQSEGEGANIEPGRSFITKFGYRHKYKINPVLALGFGVNYGYSHYLLSADSAKIFPTNQVFDKEKLRVHNIGFELFGRINFDKNRGNFLGKYMDLGGYFNWIYAANYLAITKEFDPNMNADIIKTKYTNLSYVEPFSYGFVVRLSFNKVGLCADYRISDLFKPEFNYPEMPRLTVGLDLSIE